MFFVPQNGVRTSENVGPRTVQTLPDSGFRGPKNPGKNTSH